MRRYRLEGGGSWARLDRCENVCVSGGRLAADVSKGFDRCRSKVNATPSPAGTPDPRSTEKRLMVSAHQSRSQWTGRLPRLQQSKSVRL